MRAWNLIAAAVCCAGLARADEVLLRDGTRIEGKVILDTKGGALCVQLANKGARLVERDEVQEVVADDDPLTYVRFHRYSDTWSRLEVLNRTLERAEHLAREYAVTAAPLDRLAEEVVHADLVIACTGATERLIDADMLPAREIALIDLALAGLAP